MLPPYGRVGALNDTAIRPSVPWRSCLGYRHAGSSLHCVIVSTDVRDDGAQEESAGGADNVQAG